jgi:hypothetical protein
MRKQVDMMILDFSKAFDTVPHRRLLMKLDHYGIRDHTHEWIRQWLTTRKQTVVLDGEASSEVHVDSGVPQGTVLGPLMFLMYVNDIGEGVNSEVKLFAALVVVWSMWWFQLRSFPSSTPRYGWCSTSSSVLPSML